MPRACTICRHEERAAIEAALVAGEAMRNIAERFAVSTTAVHRHKGEHVPAALVRAAGVADVAQALDVMAQLKAINAAALAILRDARASEDGALALKAIDRIQRQIELQAKLLGDLDDRPTINVLVMPEWVALRAALLHALAPYPEAREAVAGRLVALEAGHVGE